MENVIAFLESREDISIRTIEKELEIPNATINMRKKYITPKHLQVVVSYLQHHFGYDKDVPELINHVDNTGPTQVVKMYNVKRKPGFKDGLLRFQDKQGLWKRISQWCMEKGEIRDSYKAATGELLVDKIGEYYMSNNGTKVYTTFK